MAATGYQTPKGPEPALEEEIRTLRRIVDYLPRHVDSYESCRSAAKLLASIWSARESLGRLEAMLQGRHLSCCLIPEIGGSSVLEAGLERLRARRLGATIVCEHRQSLDDYAARGTGLRLRLSVALLESVFDRRSRLRSGALILRGDEVLAAGVALPLAIEPTGEDGVVLGDRQRGALALSRITDALVFVVTDGTGQTFVALDGHLRSATSL